MLDSPIQIRLSQLPVTPWRRNHDLVPALENGRRVTRILAALQGVVTERLSTLPRFPCPLYKKTRGGERTVWDQLTLFLPVTIRRLCRQEDLPQLEWYGLYTKHQDIFRETFARHQQRRSCRPPGQCTASHRATNRKEGKPSRTHITRTSWHL